MSLYTSPIILLSSIKSLDFLSNLKDNLQITSTNKQYNPIYCMGFQVFDNKKPIEDQIKTYTLSG